MTQEDKQLLLKDLCARLPYEPKARKDGMETSINLTTLDSFYYGDEIILPYLRRMSSMTEEEDKDWQLYKSRIVESCDELLEEKIAELHDWFNLHHFDYLGLIEKGLALEAPEGMYN